MDMVADQFVPQFHRMHHYVQDQQQQQQQIIQVLSFQVVLRAVVCQFASIHVLTVITMLVVSVSVMVHFRSNNFRIIDLVFGSL
jgi:hypothetical protein